MKNQHLKIPWDDYPENKTPIGNPKQCGVFEVQEYGTIKTLFLSDDDGIHVDLLKTME